MPRPFRLPLPPPPSLQAHVHHPGPQGRPGRKAGGNRLPQVPVCEADVRRDPTARETQRDGGQRPLLGQHRTERPWAWGHEPTPGPQPVHTPQTPASPTGQSASQTRKRGDRHTDMLRSRASKRSIWGTPALAAEALSAGRARRRPQSAQSAGGRFHPAWLRWEKV